LIIVLFDASLGSPGAASTNWCSFARVTPLVYGLFYVPLTVMPLIAFGLMFPLAREFKRKFGATGPTEATPLSLLIFPSEPHRSLRRLIFVLNLIIVVLIVNLLPIEMSIKRNEWQESTEEFVHCLLIDRPMSQFAAIMQPETSTSIVDCGTHPKKGLNRLAWILLHIGVSLA
jgi:hypothetical protein